MNPVVALRPFMVVFTESDRPQGPQCSMCQLAKTPHKILSMNLTIKFNQFVKLQKNLSSHLKRDFLHYKNRDIRADCHSDDYRHTCHAV